MRTKHSNKAKCVKTKEVQFRTRDSREVSLKFTQKSEFNHDLFRLSSTKHFWSFTASQQKRPHQKHDRTQEVDCESSLLQPIFMVLVPPRHVVAVVILTAKKAEVRQSSAKSDKSF